MGRHLRGKLMVIRHYTNPPQPGPPADPPKRPPTPPPPPRWRAWFLVVGILATIGLLFIPAMGSGPPVSNLNYSSFVNKVNANQVSTATIDSNGKVTGQLKGAQGQHYSSQIPTVLQNNQLTSTLESHGVSITGVGPSSSVLPIILSFLPLVLFFGLFLLLGRRAGRGIQGVMGIGSSRAKLYDQERPPTRFADVAGYEGAKQEVSEVVDFLSHPERFARAGAVGPKGVLMV
ncbi:MAG TPA: ATP-dependent metallopeptidase FtsH/Yme1/Tma family protein, partial [Acidimicrobiales bacterium]|nr:ATP-dependent metallopeptidase FtsH/Yme1/Tma family protein [Acidimicrobiales bacterium]